MTILMYRSTVPNTKITSARNERPVDLWVR
jgi:hypothetical protein